MRTLPTVHKGGGLVDHENPPHTDNERHPQRATKAGCRFSLKARMPSR